MPEHDTLPAKQRTNLSEQFLEPFHRLRGEMDRLFDEFPARWPALHLPARFGGGAMPAPAMEMTRKPDSYHISIEVPGIEPEAIDLEVEGDMLVLKGEKCSRRDEQEEDYTFSERSYGAFERRVALPADAVTDKVEAKASHGVLDIVVARDTEAAGAKHKIEIAAAE